MVHLPLTMREKKILSVFENRVFRTIFKPKREEETGVLKKCMMRNFIFAALHIKY
jgi:hypothetical protein